MPLLTFDDVMVQLTTLKDQIKNETTPGGNTALRLSDAFDKVLVALALLSDQTFLLNKAVFSTYMGSLTSDFQLDGQRVLSFMPNGLNKKLLLEPAVTNRGMIHTVMNLGAASIWWKPDGTDTINGSTGLKEILSGTISTLISFGDAGWWDPNAQ